MRAFTPLLGLAALAAAASLPAGLATAGDAGQPSAQTQGAPS